MNFLGRMASYSNFWFARVWCILFMGKFLFSFGYDTVPFVPLEMFLKVFKERIICLSEGTGGGSNSDSRSGRVWG